MMKETNGVGQGTACKNAVLFLIFKRKEATMQVLQAIREARPPRLYIAADGPRPDRPDEQKQCRELRKLVIEGVDWPCEVKTLFRENNLGCKLAVSGAIDWFFDQEEQGIILEDDCLTSRTFFRFCDELLEKYAHDPSVGGITADFRTLTSDHGANEYGRVCYTMIWGWATWRRVWKMYDITMEGYNGDVDQIERVRPKRTATKIYLKSVFDSVKYENMDTWDYQFTYLCLAKKMDFLHPHVNMCTNIGFDGNATHTTFNDDINAWLPRQDVQFPLKGPVTDRKYEDWLDRRVYTHRALPIRAIQRLQHWCRGRGLNISSRRF